MLDANALVSGLGWSGPPSVIVDSVLAGELLLVSSPPLLDELERVLAYPKLAALFPDPAVIGGWIRAVAESGRAGVHARRGSRRAGQPSPGGGGRGTS
ncbi:PilT domain-containing protein [mine drainage metagenome]|uniref:PilT domain-containing protein n=1 Tax=mine drainage metagenome TaxID=410659 RepID=T1B616_9ZZZZ